MGTPQDLIDMVKAILLEFQCPEVYMSPKGKAYPNIVGEVMAHQVGGHQLITLCLNSKNELVRCHSEMVTVQGIF